MAWEIRKGRKYYYRSRKVNGRVRREYVGTGEVAEVAARLDAERVRIRADMWQSRAELEGLDALLEQLDREVHEIVSAAMALAGFQWHRGDWRRKRTVATNDTPPAPVEPNAQPPAFRDLIARARAGDPTAMNPLRQMFDDPDTVEAYGGNVAVRSVDMTIRMMVGTDLVSEEAIHRKLERLRAELAGPTPTPLERLVVDRVVAQWLHLHKLEGDYAVAGDRNPEKAGYYQRAMTAAQNRYFTAIRELARVRRSVLPALQVNIAREQVNVVNAPKE